MILKDARENYYFHTGKVSDIVRQLGLGAIAIVWLFRSGSLNSTIIPEALILPLKLVVAGLALDLLQYALGAAFWGFFQWRKEHIGATESDEFKAPSSLLKIGLMERLERSAEPLSRFSNVSQTHVEL